LYVCKGKRVVRIKQVWCSLFINFLNQCTFIGYKCVILHLRCADPFCTVFAES
jgi:hypothetical protein